MEVIRHNIEFFTEDGQIHDVNSPISVNIDANLDKLGTTAEIVIPFAGGFKKAKKGTMRSLFQVLPLELKYADKEGKVYTIKAKTTRVEISLGLTRSVKEYVPDIREFRGTIRNFKRSGNNIVIQCEDPISLFRDSRFRFAFKAATLSDVIAKCFSKMGYEFNGGNVYKDPLLNSTNVSDKAERPALELVKNEKLNALGIVTSKGSFKMGEYFSGSAFIDDIDVPNLTLSGYMTVAEVFAKLRQTYKIYSYFREKRFDKDGILSSELVFHSGLRYFRSNRDYFPAVFSYPYNSGSNAIIDAENLTYNSFDKANDLVVIVSTGRGRETDTLLTTDGVKFTASYDTKVEGVEVVAKTNEEIEEVLGTRGTKIELKLPNLAQKTMLRIASSKWESVPGAGITGSFSTFLTVGLDKSDKIDLRYEDYYARYYVDRVIKKLDSSTGLTQTVHIKNRLKE